MNLSHPTKPPHLYKWGGKLFLILRLIFYILSAGAIFTTLFLLYLGLKESGRPVEMPSQPVIGIDETNFQKAIERSNK